MKLKNIFALAIACGAALVMSVAAHAATEVKAQGVTTDEYGVTVPIVINTTDFENINELSAVQMTLKYDSNVWDYYQTTNDASVVDRRGNKVLVGSVAANVVTPGEVIIVYVCDGSNGFATTDENGTIPVCTVTFDKKGNIPDSISDNDFSTNVVLVEDYNEGGGPNNYVIRTDEFKSFFTFDVTGDLGGNEVVALGASTDGGATIQPLDKYASTTWTDGMAYAEATTKFVVALNNTTGTTAVADVIIYGQLEDGTYIPLAEHNKNGFLVQSFK